MKTIEGSLKYFGGSIDFFQNKRAVMVMTTMSLFVIAFDIYASVMVEFGFANRTLRIASTAYSVVIMALVIFQCAV